MQVIGAIICALVGLRLLQSVFQARRSAAARRLHETRELQLLDERVAATRAVRIQRENEQLHWNGYRKFRVKQKVTEADGICSFYLIPHDGKALPAFRPGQFLTFRIKVPGRSADDIRTLIRCYSLSDAPRPEQFRITVKRVPATEPGAPAGVVSNYLLDSVDAGDLLDVQAPRGDFFLNPQENRPVVLVGGGIGITPMLSMLNAVIAAGVRRDIWLFYGVRNSADQIMKEHLQQLVDSQRNLHLRICYSRPLPADRPGTDFHHAGHVTAELIRDVVQVNNYSFYVCGPPAMMETLIPGLREWGVPDDRIHSEAFGPAALPRRSDGRQTADCSSDNSDTNGHAECLVEFTRTGQTIRWDDQAASLLDFAISHGIDLESGCRAGSCGSCQVAIRKGQVRWLTEASADCDDGSCLACISVPEGPLILDA